MLPVIANLVNFIILACFLGFMLRKPASGMLRKRTDMIQEQLRLAQDELEKALDLKRQYEQKIEEVARERDIILDDAQKSAGETSRRVIAEAEKDAAAIRDRAAANAAFEWDRAGAEMRAIIIDASTAAAERFVSLAINNEAHDRLFTKVLADLEEVVWSD